VVIEVIEFDDLVVQLHSNFSITCSIWSELIIIKLVEAFSEGSTTEWSEEINSVLGWKIKAVANCLGQHRKVDSRVEVSVFVDWIVVDWLWDNLIKMEAWWCHQEDLGLRWKVHILSAEGDVFVLEGHSCLVGFHLGNL